MKQGCSLTAFFIVNVGQSNKVSAGYFQDDCSANDLKIAVQEQIGSRPFDLSILR